MNDFRELIIWQKAMDMIVDIYKISAKFPSEERYGLTSQIRRAVISVPSNIAEGFGRKTTSDFIHFLHISRGSLYEFQTQLEVSLRLSFISKNEADELLVKAKEIEKMINSLILSLKKRIKS
jgi:four helix bundle protein